jgi:hypothetical protein
MSRLYNDDGSRKKFKCCNHCAYIKPEDHPNGYFPHPSPCAYRLIGVGCIGEQEYENNTDNGS